MAIYNNETDPNVRQWENEQPSPSIPVKEELLDIEKSFYMDICRAYNAGKQNMTDTFNKGKDGFISSHDYFIKEFPGFKTNVP